MERKLAEEVNEQYKHRQLTIAAASNKLAHRNLMLTVSLAIFTAVGALAAVYQGKISARSAKAAEDAVMVANRTLCEQASSRRASEDASAQSLQTTIDNFHLDQRAWLATTWVHEKAPDDIYVGFQNTGRTPALRVNVYRASTTSLRSIPLFDRIPAENRKAVVAPNAVNYSSVALDASDSQALLAHQRGVFVYGTV